MKKSRSSAKKDNSAGNATQRLYRKKESRHSRMKVRDLEGYLDEYPGDMGPSMLGLGDTGHP